MSPEQKLSGLLRREVRLRELRGLKFTDFDTVETGWVWALATSLFELGILHPSDAQILGDGLGGSPEAIAEFKGGLWQAETTEVAMRGELQRLRGDR